MIKIYADTSDIEEIKEMDRNPLVKGFTTNPTLMRKAGVQNYEEWAKAILRITDKPVSFEVIADDFAEMERQARKIASWGKNVYVKIPITNTKGGSSVDLINKLSNDGIKVNATAIFYKQQYDKLIPVAPLIVSIFAGRIADTGFNPDVFFRSKYIIPNAEYLWASPREVLNIYQAEQANADIITCTPDLIRKYEKLKGYDLNQFSLDTVKMFYDDAKESGYNL